MTDEEAAAALAEASLEFESRRHDEEKSKEVERARAVERAKEVERARVADRAKEVERARAADRAREAEKNSPNRSLDEVFRTVASSLGGSFVLAFVPPPGAAGTGYPAPIPSLGLASTDQDMDAARKTVEQLTQGVLKIRG